MAKMPALPRRPSNPVLKGDAEREQVEGKTGHELAMGGGPERDRHRGEEEADDGGPQEDRGRGAGNQHSQGQGPAYRGTWSEPDREPDCKGDDAGRAADCLGLPSK